MPTSLHQRSVPVDAAKTAAIFGTLLIHASAAGGFSGAAGSPEWTAALFWNALLRCAVPVFFMCSGALLLPPEKEVTVRTIWRKYVPRILIALLFWAAAYDGWQLLLAVRRTGVLEAAALQKTARDWLLFRHKSHLYYLHIILLVYALLPLTRLFAAKADRRLLRYGLAVWFLLGILLPTARFFPPLSLLTGIPAQYPINLTWGAVGYGVLGYALSQEARTRRPWHFLLLYLAGFCVTFGGTLGLSLAKGSLYEGLLNGNSLGVCLQAAGIFGFCASRFADWERCRLTETVSRASFCVYLTHVFFLEFLNARGIAAGLLPNVWVIPALALACFAAGFLAWLILRRVPWVRKYLI